MPTGYLEELRQREKFGKWFILMGRDPGETQAIGVHPSALFSTLADVEDSRS